MAKGSPLMGTQRGRLGESVLYRKQGEQVSRAYIAHPANPRSGSQQLQRMIVASCNAAYSGMKEICDHSFENVATGQKSFSFFMQQNISKYRRTLGYVTGEVEFTELYSFVTPKTNSIPTAPFIVARGSLNPVKFVVFRQADLGDGDLPTALQQTQLVYFPLDAPDGMPPRSEKQMPETLSSNGYKEGDMLTFVGIIRTPNQISIMDEQRFVYARFTVCKDKTGDGFLYLVCTKTSHGEGHPGKLEHDIFRYDYWKTFSTDGAVTFAGFDMMHVIGFPSDANIVMGGWIHSRPLGGGRFLRSNCEMMRNDICLDAYRPNWIFENVSGYDAYPLWQNQVETIGESLYVLGGGSK